MVHILPHWNWPERMGQVTPVFVYTSGDEAELFLNGKSLGRRRKPRLAPWPENLAAGKAASASSGTAAGLAVDGRSDTLWEANKGSDPAWWQVDLGAVQTLRGIDIDFAGAAKGYRYRIVASSEGSVWQPLITDTEARGDQTHIDYQVDARARLVRVEFLPDNRPKPAIKEFAAYSTPLPTDEDCYRLRWHDVVYQPGELRAVAYKQGKVWAETSIKTTGPAARLELAPDRSPIRADGEDLSFVTVTVADRDGRPVPGSKNLLTFALSGPGEIVAFDNGDPTSHESFQGSENHAWNGQCLVIIRSKPDCPGIIKLSASSEGFAPADAEIRTTADSSGAGQGSRSLF
jgi:hypothetical protein